MINLNITRFRCINISICGVLHNSGYFSNEYISVVSTSQFVVCYNNSEFFLFHLSVVSTSQFVVCYNIPHCKEMCSCVLRGHRLRTYNRPNVFINIFKNVSVFLFLYRPFLPYNSPTALIRSIPSCAK